jgi:SAM-dependent methyltransferase
VNGGEPDRWSAAAAAWSASWGQHALPVWQRITGAVPLTSQARVLDVGCGSGELLAFLVGTGARLAGADTSPEMVTRAAALVPAATVRLAGAHDLPWPDQSFDLVLAVNVLEMAGDSALSELVRVTAAGGHIAVANWAEDELNDTEELEQAVDRRRGHPAGPPSNRRRQAALTALFTDAGLSVIVEDVVHLPFRADDDDALATAILLSAPASSSTRDKQALLVAARRFRRADGSYELTTAMRYAVARRDRAVTSAAGTT